MCARGTEGRGEGRGHNVVVVKDRRTRGTRGKVGKALLTVVVVAGGGDVVGREFGIVALESIIHDGHHHATGEREGGREVGGWVR